jgi:hypothetical protein
LNIDELEAQNRHSSLGEDITTERFERLIAEMLDAGARQDGELSPNLGDGRGQAAAV